jgi:hypothetical protein
MVASWAQNALRFWSVSPISSCPCWANDGPDPFGDIASDLLVGYTETGQKRRSI